MPSLPSLILLWSRQKVSQIDGPLPSTAAAPSIWKELVATPQVKSEGKLLRKSKSGLLVMELSDRCWERIQV